MVDRRLRNRIGLGALAVGGSLLSFTAGFYGAEYLGPPLEVRKTGSVVSLDRRCVVFVGDSNGDGEVDLAGILQENIARFPRQARDALLEAHAGNIRSRIAVCDVTVR